ncbi:MAG: biotin/lipoyl-containing protein [Candidatus Zixiibacteriota bacterium]
MAHSENRYLVTVDDVEFDLAIMSKGGSFEIEYNGALYKVEAHRLSDRKYLFKIDESSSEVDISRNGGGYNIYLEGKDMIARVEPYHLAELRKKAGKALAGAAEKMVRAPMPGLVLSMAVKPGDKVKKGMTLAVIEAMKMENLIRAAADGTVKEIFAAPGKAVEKNENLLEIE